MLSAEPGSYLSCSATERAESSSRFSSTRYVNNWLNRPINRWWSVLAGAVGTALGAGIVMGYGFGILAQSMIAELGWRRDIVANMYGAFSFGSGLGMLILGWLISQYGIRFPAVIFSILFGICFASIAVIPPNPTIYLLLFTVVGLSGAACSAMPYSVAVSGFFDRYRGLALGLVIAGSGVGCMALPHLAEALVNGPGWRTGFVLMGLGPGLIAAVGLIFLVRTPDGAVIGTGRVKIANRKAKLAFPSYLGSPFFWLILIPILCVSIATSGVVGNLVFLFSDRGIPSTLIATLLSVTGLSAWLGSLTGGVLLDRVFAPYAAATVYALTAMGILLLAFVPGTASAFLAVSLIGLAVGSEAEIITFLVGRYFTLADFSRIVGIIWVSWAWGGGAGIALGGKAYVLSGSYVAALLFFAVALALAASLMFFLGPYRYPQHD